MFFSAKNAVAGQSPSAQFQCFFPWLCCVRFIHEDRVPLLKISLVQILPLCSRIENPIRCATSARRTSSRRTSHVGTSHVGTSHALIMACRRADLRRATCDVIPMLVHENPRFNLDICCYTRCHSNRYQRKFRGICQWGCHRH